MRYPIVPLLLSILGVTALDARDGHLGAPYARSPLDAHAHAAFHRDVIAKRVATTKQSTTSVKTTSKKSTSTTTSTSARLSSTPTAARFCRPRPSTTSTSATTSKASSTSTAKSSSTTTAKSSSVTTAKSSSSTTRTTSTSAANPSNTVAVGASNTWTLVQDFSGPSFFNQWGFYNLADPTHGLVNFVDYQTALGSSLINILPNGSAWMGIDTTNVVSQSRASVRLESFFTYNQGLVILDASHVPTGCGTWPAFWSFGPNWPASGEIDIVEGTSDETVNQASIHTSAGCTLPSSNLGSLGMQGSWLNGPTNCDPYATQGTGCGIRDTDTRSFGPGFNANGGGVYAMIWVEAGVQVWFFPRQSIPADIVSGQPKPGLWPSSQLKAFWPSTTCNAKTFFANHHLVFDTTLCGDWAANTWQQATIAGQTASCAALTGYSTCAAYVLNNGQKFANAFWEVNYVRVFQDPADPLMNFTYNYPSSTTSTSALSTSTPTTTSTSTSIATSASTSTTANSSTSSSGAVSSTTPAP